MWLFKKRRKEVSADDKTRISDKVAGKIAGVGIKMQQLFGDKMNKIFMHTDFKRLKIFLLLFCICAGGYSLYLIIDGVVSPDKKQKPFKVQQIDVPKHFDKTGAEDLMPEAYITDETRQQIEQFKKYMDSLNRNNKGEHDSILQARPGLMDSVQVLEQIYLSQQQK